MLFSYKADTGIASPKLHRKLHTAAGRAEATGAIYREEQGFLSPAGQHTPASGIAWPSTYAQHDSFFSVTAKPVNLWEHKGYFSFGHSVAFDLLLAVLSSARAKCCHSAVFIAHFKPDLSVQRIFLFSLLHNSPDSRTKQKPHEGLALTQQAPWWLQYSSY